jgi:hypothetical protein
MSRNPSIGIWLVCSSFVLSLSGCATILSERKYEVTIDNPGGPTCFSVRDRRNQVIESGVTPHQVTLDAKSGWVMSAKYKIDYAGQNGVQTRELKAKIDPWTAGNIVIGGVPGIAIDAVSGAMWRLDRRVTGQVPAELVVANESQGAALLASGSMPSGSTTPGPSGSGDSPDIRQAGFSR